MLSYLYIFLAVKNEPNFLTVVLVGLFQVMLTLVSLARLASIRLSCINLELLGDILYCECCCVR